MKPERAARLVSRWVRLYTRRLPASLAQRRIEEIEADLHDQIADERRRGRGDRRIAAAILSRLARGLAADVSWRDRHAETTHRSTAAILLAVGALLLIPLVAMQLTDEVAWGPADFIVAGTLLAGTVLLLRAAARRVGDVASRAAFGVALAASLLLVWAILAVGMVGADGDPVDALYLGVLAIGIVGASRARLRPSGMARVLLAMALAQAGVAAVALVSGRHQAPAGSLLEILGTNGFFAALFIGSAWLFRHAARDRPAARPRPRD